MYEKGDNFHCLQKKKKKNIQDGLLFLACQAFIRKSHLHVKTLFLQC